MELCALESREQELKTAKQDLEAQLSSVVKQSRETLNDSQIELNKSKMHNQSLEKKYEVCFIGVHPCHACSAKSKRDVIRETSE